MKTSEAKNGGIKPIPAILILGCVGIAGIALWGLSSKQSNNVEETELPGEIKESTIVEGNTATGTNIQSDTQPQTSGSIDSNKEEDQQLSDSAIAAIKKEAIEEHRNRIMRNMTENLLSPGVNQMIYQQQRVLLKDQYQELVKSLGFNDKEAEYFLDLVTARRMLEADFGMKLVTGMLSPEERDRLVEKLGQDTKPILDEIDHFLNNADDSDFFKYYNQTEQQRTAIRSMIAEAQQNNIPLDSDVGEQLVKIMFDSVNNSAFSVEFGGDGEPDYSKLSHADIETLKLEMSALVPSISQSVSTLLSPEQLSLFEKAYEKYITSAAARWKMITQLTQTPQQ